MFNVFGPYGDFLNRRNNNNDDDDEKTFRSLDKTEPNAAAGTFRLVQIPVKAMKPGGLRLFLMFYLLGMQNTPDKNSWKAHQPSTEEYVLDLWFHDQTGVLSVELSNNKVTIDRVGSSPSTQYLMQEAVIVQGILDELNQCATDQSVAEHHRLLVLEDSDAIEKARDALAFG